MSRRQDLQSTLAWRSDLYPRALKSVPVTDFFDAAMPVRVVGTDIVVRNSFTSCLLDVDVSMQLTVLLCECWGFTGDTCAGDVAVMLMLQTFNTQQRPMELAALLCLEAAKLLRQCTLRILARRLKESQQQTGQAMAAVWWSPQTAATPITSQGAR